jgi:D-alanyl-D-alanine carboxypeptidase
MARLTAHGAAEGQGAIVKGEAAREGAGSPLDLPGDWFETAHGLGMARGDRVRRVLEFIRTCILVVGLLALSVLAAGVLLTSLLKGGPSSATQTMVHLLPGSHRGLAPPDGPACSGPPSFVASASQNAASLDTAVSQPFGVSETGWAIYAPLIAHEIGTTCAPDSAGFAAAFSRWQKTQGLVSTGEVDVPALSRLATTWLLRRPFVRAMKSGCPLPPTAQNLATAAPAESFGGKMIQARPAVLNAYRRMVAAARAQTGVAPPLLTIASAYRGPDEEAARCADGSCGNPAKARCSAHRTGLALDLYLGAVPGGEAFSTSEENRLFQSRSPAYRWLVAHADQFGFAPYPYEPWHWEWTGEPI